VASEQLERTWRPSQADLTRLSIGHDSTNAKRPLQQRQVAITARNGHQILVMKNYLLSNCPPHSRTRPPQAEQVGRREQRSQHGEVGTQIISQPVEKCCRRINHKWTVDNSQ
jgi:hypothetical protein